MNDVEAFRLYEAWLKAQEPQKSLYAGKLIEEAGIDPSAFKASGIKGNRE